MEPGITSSAGWIEIASAREQKAIDGYRVMFDLVPPANGDEPINLRVLLANEGLPLTETWIYQWTPPPRSKRRKTALPACHVNTHLDKRVETR